MNKRNNMERCFLSYCILLQGFLSLVLLAFPLAHAWADDHVPELQLMGGQVVGSLRTENYDREADVHKPLTQQNFELDLTAAPNNTPVLLASDAGFRLTDKALVTLSKSDSHLRLDYSAELQVAGGSVLSTNEAYYQTNLQFRVAPSAGAPVGTPVQIKVAAAGSTTNIFNGFGGPRAIGNTLNEVRLDYISPIDGKIPNFSVFLENGLLKEAMDLTYTLETGEVGGMYKVGDVLTVGVDLFAVNIGSRTGMGAQVDISFVVPQQTITSFSPPSFWGLSDLQLEATASSGLPVEFSVVSGPATIDGNILSPTGPGSVVVRANQPGNDSFAAAIPVEKTITIEGGIAQVKILKGVASVIGNGKQRLLKIGDWVDRGDIVKTGDKSTVGFKLIDESWIIIAPNSRMTIIEFSARYPSIIDLVEGKIRSDISKDYLLQEDKTKPKMYLKTPNATLGIGGAEFEVSYTIRNGIGTTSIQMIEGLVEMEDLTTGKITMLKDQDSLQIQSPAIVPVLALFDQSGKRLARGATAPHFGNVIARASKLARFEIRNLGIADLTDIKPVISGRHAREFQIIKQPKSTLEPEEKSALAIRFSPKSAGPKRAILRITSSDPEGKPFEVILTGDGVAATPNLVVEWPAGSQVSNGDSRKFGSAVVGLGGSTRTVTLRNTGVSPLTGISATMVGSHPGDFLVGKVPASIPPGKKVTFNVTFKPQDLGARTAVMELRSNNPIFPIFLVYVKGVGGVLK